MEVKEAPPKTSTDSGDGSDHFKVLITADTHFKPQTPPDVATRALRKSFEENGVPLLGSSIMRLKCMCDKGCPEGTLYGLIVPRNERALGVLMHFYVHMHGTNIEDTNDPELKVGSFTEQVWEEPSPY